MKCELCRHNAEPFNRCLKCQKISAQTEDIQALSRTELEQEVARLTYVNRLLNLIFANQTNPLLIMDGEGVIILVNEAYERLADVRRTDLLGKNIKDLVGTVISRSTTVEALAQKKKVTLDQELLKSGRTGISTSVPILNGQEIELIIGCNFDPESVETIQRQLELERKKSRMYLAELEQYKERQKARGGLIAQDKRTLEVLERAERVAKVDSSVLIIGETGTGKEEFAKHIHQTSGRRDKPFVAVNCGAIPESLLESELFGYEKGAFTGADTKGKIGLFEAADGGTIFLDEIGDLPMSIQVKLLRVLQEHAIQKVGAYKSTPVDVRVLAATNQDLKQMVKENRFRMDLYYRLGVVLLNIPPLRERVGDIVPLSVHFVEELNRRFCTHKTLAPSACQALRQYDWPGNVRELKNILEEVVIMSGRDIITKQDLGLSKGSQWSEAPLDATPLPELMADMEFRHLQGALEREGSIRKAAAYLGMPATTFARRIKRLREQLGLPEE